MNYTFGDRCAAVDIDDLVRKPTYHHIQRCVSRRDGAQFSGTVAEAASWKPPSEDPDHYEDTHEHRQGVFQMGGGVLLAVGTLLLAVSIYGTFFVESFPQ